MEHRKARACKMRSSLPPFRRERKNRLRVLIYLEFVRLRHGLLKIPLISGLSRACEEVRGLSARRMLGHTKHGQRERGHRAHSICALPTALARSASQTDNKLIIELLNNSSYLIRGLIKLRSLPPPPFPLLRERRFETPVNFIRDS